ncbi:MAG: NUDIX hydrolase [Sandaracinaceae bacterium]
MSARQRVLTATKFAVDRLDVPLRAGGSVRREVVVHPGAVVVLPWLDDGRLVLIRSYRFAIERPLVELPAGTLEAGEDPREAAVRELQEETGYRAEAVWPLSSFYPSPGICDEVMHAFVAEGLTPGPQALEPTEDIEVLALRVDEVEARVRAGELVDAKTLATLLLWRLRGPSARPGSPRR